MAKKQKTASLIGSWAFFVGVVLAVVLGVINVHTESPMPFILVIIGLIVGLLNITAREAMGFLTASAVLVIVTALSQEVIGDVFVTANMAWASNILVALLLVFVPATIVVSLRAVFSLAQELRKPPVSV